MVAYTNPDCLPYFEGTDELCVDTGQPCDPSTVWCDFARIVDTKLDAYDEVVRRTAGSVPMAWVETEVPTVLNIGATINPVFTTVRADTNGMVDLDTLSYGFVIVTPGLYQVWGYIYGLFDSGNVSDASPGFTIAFVPFGPFPITNVLEADSAALNANQVATSHASIVTNLQAGQRVAMEITSGGSTNDQVNFSKISMGATWMGDLP